MSQRNLTRVAGACVGVSLAVLALLGARPAAQVPSLPAAARFSLVSTGELEAVPSRPRPLLVADSLRPGRPPVAASFSLRNQTGGSLAVALVTRPDSTALDGQLRVRLSAGGAILADATLQGMRQRAPWLDLPSGARVRLRLEAWIPASVRTDYEGRFVRVAIVPSSHPGGGW